MIPTRRESTTVQSERSKKERHLRLSSPSRIIYPPHPLVSRHPRRAEMGAGRVVHHLRIIFLVYLFGEERERTEIGTNARDPRVFEIGSPVRFDE